MTRTDTERLEWIWMNSDKAMWIIEAAEESAPLTYCGDAEPFRAAIDEAMNAEER